MDLDKPERTGLFALLFCSQWMIREGAWNIAMNSLLQGPNTRKEANANNVKIATSLVCAAAAAPAAIATILPPLAAKATAAITTRPLPPAADDAPAAAITGLLSLAARAAGTVVIAV
ncbi:uncharacterized protein LY79DRAFT_186488 [Colletotrichum navitas]|uniref:Uncharacterized protein n=1 Tax=Colletotrichum navitas TaxID=681940 RepID=A0AAD8PIJ2_9PEZI|nr:uncharacterized protein LY79DRAFT_186488 [Colletotrichum navitas]KAK1561612.1 hypothetical protein LY79DRAFT_186488 [Colletotrichum navitas]